MNQSRMLNAEKVFKLVLIIVNHEMDRNYDLFKITYTVRSAKIIGGSIFRITDRDAFNISPKK